MPLQEDDELYHTQTLCNQVLGHGGIFLRRRENGSVGTLLAPRIDHGNNIFKVGFVARYYRRIQV
jgi:hypothetical protein